MKSLILSSLAFLLMARSGASAQDDISPGQWPMGYYINAGLLADYGFYGYDTMVTSRDARLGYQLEIGSPSFAMPVGYSKGQGVDIMSLKPRFQHFISFGSTMYSVGGGLGAVYNYWRSNLTVGAVDASVSVHEFGVQPSLKVLIRPLPNVHVMVNLISVDMNFWRAISGSSGIKNLGNFSTTDKSFGLVYTGGASVGLNF